jgi:hypothetical protein
MENSHKDVKSFEPRYQFNNRKDLKIKDTLNDLCKNHITPSNYSLFELQKKEAKKFFDRYPEDNKKQHLTFKYIADISTIDQFCNHIYGRFLMIGLCFVLDKTIEKAFCCISGKEFKQSTRNLPSKINSYFKINNIKSKRLSKFYSLSDEEIHFLLELSELKGKQELQKELTAWHYRINMNRVDND